ncbi:MAG TPA: glycosyltransferase [Gemmatimonadales bacterium]|jgi:rhamnosyl/mannosyltransferase|nr:glycosyltransferase [Gemmatimonadales bacterium]
MRILHLAKYYWPRSGGMERVVQGLAEGAAALGHEVEVVAVQEALGPHRDGSARRRASVTRAMSFGALGSQEVAPGYIAAAWKRADVIHVHHPHPLADLAAFLRAFRTPVVVTHHADARRGIYRPWIRLVLKRARAIAVPSRAHLALSTELTGFEGKVEVIPFGIDERRWAFVPPPPPDAAPRAIFIGRLLPYKGVDVLLRALERVPDLKLDVVGSGPEMPRLRTLAQALAVSDRVRWWGEYPDDDLPRRMADADFLVLPSVTVEEMFGLVILEAMAAGRPVITTALPSAVREVNVPGTTGLEVPLRDVGALAHALETLGHDRELRWRLGQAGQERVRAQFTQSMMAERYVALYERVRREK